MADVIGPNSYLPGHYLIVPKGQTCDGDHSTPVAAKYRIVGETDSFGSEVNDYCEACRNEMLRLRDIEGPELCTCEWCKTPNVETKPTRDFEEGLSGRVYDVCSACRKRQNDAIADELAADDRDNHHSPYYGDVDDGDDDILDAFDPEVDDRVRSAGFPDT